MTRRRFTCGRGSAHRQKASKISHFRGQRSSGNRMGRAIGSDGALENNNGQEPQQKPLKGAHK